VRIALAHVVLSDQDVKGSYVQNVLYEERIWISLDLAFDQDEGMKALIVWTLNGLKIARISFKVKPAQVAGSIKRYQLCNAVTNLWTEVVVRLVMESSIMYIFAWIC